MSLYEQWKERAYSQSTPQDYETFWKEYLPKEQAVYETILENQNQTIQGSLEVLSEKFDMECVTFVGFLDGINTSLKNENDLEAIHEHSEITLSVDFEKLYYNMLEAKADWLYNLPQWDDILSIDKRKEIKTAHNKTKTVIKEKKIGRNEPCPCGSGKKYKKCCLNKES